MKKEILTLIASAFIRKRAPKLDLPRQIKLMSPVPSNDLFRKFDFFYSPYNFVINTSKHMTFDEDEHN